VLDLVKALRPAASASACGGPDPVCARLLVATTALTLSSSRTTQGPTLIATLAQA
jgi:hypothetical protein